jgi:TolB-like protein
VTTVNSSEISLAIFPLENITDQNGMASFCKSFYIDLVTELTRFQQFKIIPLESVIDGTKTDYSIKGSFGYQKEIYRINAQLVNNHNNHIVWAERFEGDIESIFDIQEAVIKQIVSSLQLQVNNDVLIHIRKKSPQTLKAYEHWLFGMEELKKGSFEADEKARIHFQQAIEIDPGYSLAYTGMSLTYFNEWSCQLWERWDVSKRGAFEWAQKAIDLNEKDYVAAMVLGRVYLYEAEYEIAEHYLRRALRQNPNDTTNLIQIASCFVYLGYLVEAESIYSKVQELDPLNGHNYHHVAALIAFEKGEFKRCISLSATARLVWVDFPAMIAAAHYETGDFDSMHRWWTHFLDEFRKKIAKDSEADTTQAVRWLIDVSPYKNTKYTRFWEFIGGKQVARSERQFEKATPPDKNYFLKENDVWQISYDKKQVLITEVKGLNDLAKMLGHPEKQFHCAELMGSGLEALAEPVFDERAKRSYQKKILELQEEIRWSENNNDLQRSSYLHEEYDQIVDHLSSSLGLKGRIRKSHDNFDKTRSAVTWRIRNAIQKIEKAHPILGKHLSASIRTGIFCSYMPEKSIKWITGEDFFS